ncbi:MAG: TatD family hydrolase [Candidatus Aenigmarchaeota archaeon]|nr:TatD family hydrolase [Candidatus Aenigmarchaeota archaeon]
MIDTHCHLAHPDLIKNIDQIIQDAKKQMDAIITSIAPGDKEKSFEIYEKYKGFVYVSLGIHPIDVKEMTDKEIDQYKDFVLSHKNDIVAIGEIGLDYHWIKDKKTNERTKRVFIEFLDIAKQLNLPVILHLRKAAQEGFDIITNNDIKKAVFHCYAGNLTLAKEIIEQGYYISISTNLMGSKNTKKIAKKFPLENLLTETDAPFLSPFSGKPNVPQNVKFILEKMSELRQQPIEEIDKIIVNNAKKIFKI